MLVKSAEFSVGEKSEDIMITVLRRLASNTYAGIATGAVLALALLLPTATFADNAANVGMSLGVANNTAGDTDYKDSINASQGQTVQVRVYYVNHEAADSNKVANNIRTKITMPVAGKVAVVKASVQTDGGTAVNREVTVNTDRDDATLQYVPGSAVWKHNTGTAAAPKIVETKVSDDIVTGGQGVILENEKPGDAYGATVSIMARVGGGGVKVTSQSQKQGETGKWSASNTANPGDTMRYMISYQNTSTAAQNAVVARDVLPANATFVGGTTMATNPLNPNGVKLNDGVTSVAGVDIGNYAAGANAYVTFDVKLPDADKLTCGGNALKNTGVIKLADGGEYYATSVTNVTRNCSGTTTNPTSSTTTPVYSCDSLTVTKLDGRKIEAKLNYTARDGAKLKTATYDFGDGSTPLTTDKTTVQYTYAKDGDFKVSTSLLVTANDKDQTVTNDACNQTVSFAPVATATPTTPTAAPGALPGTGPGQVFGLFAVVAVAATIGHRLYLTRRLNRANY